MYNAFKYKKVVFLSLIMFVITFLLSCVSIILLYNNSRKNVENRLSDIVQRERFFALSILNDNPGKELHILEHIQDTVHHGKYGEVIFVRPVNDSIEFLLSAKNSALNPKYHKTDLAGTSVYRAVNKETGFLKDTDENGEEIFAAYTYVEKLNWGIIAKIPKSVTNKPFVHAFLVVLSFSLGLIIVSIIILSRTTNPILDNLRKNEQLLIKAKEKAESLGKNYENIFTNSPLGIFVIDIINGEYVFNSINPASEILLGFKSEELSGKTLKYIEEQFGVEGKNYLENIFNEIVMSKETKMYEETIILHDRQLEVNTTIRPLIDFKGEVFRLIGTHLDISRLKKAEEELRIAKEKAEESEKQLIKAQKTSKTGNWIWYVQENRVWWSDEMYRIFEIDKETFTGNLDEYFSSFSLFLYCSAKSSEKPIIAFMGVRIS